MEQAIFARLRAAGGDESVLVVAHRLATIAAADEVVFLENGGGERPGWPRGAARPQRAVPRALVSAFADDAAERAETAERAERTGDPRAHRDPRAHPDRRGGPAVTELAQTASLTARDTLRQGLRISPELRRGSASPSSWPWSPRRAGSSSPSSCSAPWTTASPAPPGPLDLVLRYVALAGIAVVVTALSSYVLNVRLFRSSEAGLTTLRTTAFRHIHDLSMLTQNTERRGSLVSRVTSDVDTISMFVQWGGIMLLLSLIQLTLATVVMVAFSPVLAVVVWACFVPLFFLIRRFQTLVGKAYTQVRARVGDLLSAISRSRSSAPRRSGPTVEERTAARVDAAVEAHRRAAIVAQQRSVYAFTAGQGASPG